MKELFEICTALETLGDHPCALATVIHVEGSAYRRAGARMLLTPEGRSWGMVSGGCLEHDVLDHARRALQSGKARVVRYDSTSDEENDDIVFGTGLGCRGILDVLIEPVTTPFRDSLLCAVAHCRQSRRNGAMATMVELNPGQVSAGVHAFLSPDGSWEGSDLLVPVLNLNAGMMAAEETALFSCSTPRGAARVFVQKLFPPVQLVLFGGWLDVVPLIRMGREIGFRVAVVDARQRASSHRLFREADAVLLQAPEKALAHIPLDARTVAVLMNHHVERDKEALAALLPRSLPYIGMLGPKRRQERILEALKNEGMPMSEEMLQPLHGPVGLDLGAKSPEEIAVSIVSEILAVLNGRNAKGISDRKAAVPGGCQAVDVRNQALKTRAHD